jgi:hypothetical protein
MLLVRHLNKRGEGPSLYRGGGSIGFLAACRSAWLVAADPECAGQRVLAQVKNNLAPPQPSLAYRIEEPYAGQLTINWLGPSDRSADQLLGRRPSKEEVAPKQRELARDWLEDFLDDGARTSEEIWQSAQQAGLSERTLFRAKGDLHVTTERVKLNGKRLSYWLLPNQEIPYDIKRQAAEEMSRDFFRHIMARSAEKEEKKSQEAGLEEMGQEPPKS